MKLNFGNIFYIIFSDLFLASWSSFVVFYLAEIGFPGLISNYLNPNLVILVVLLSAVAAAYLEDEKQK